MRAGLVIVAFIVAGVVGFNVLIFVVMKPTCSQDTTAIWTNIYTGWICVQGYRP